VVLDAYLSDMLGDTDDENQASLSEDSSSGTSNDGAAPHASAPVGRSCEGASADALRRTHLSSSSSSDGTTARSGNTNSSSGRGSVDGGTQYTDPDHAYDKEISHLSGGSPSRGGVSPLHSMASPATSTTTSTSTNASSTTSIDITSTTGATAATGVVRPVSEHDSDMGAMKNQYQRMQQITAQLEQVAQLENMLEQQRDRLAAEVDTLKAAKRELRLRGFVSGRPLSVVIEQHPL
jgi:hypothetical protein